MADASSRSWSSASMIAKSWGQGAQHSQGLHALFMHIPGLKVATPSNAHDAKACMIAAIRDDNPVIFVEHLRLNPTPSPHHSPVVPIHWALPNFRADRLDYFST